MRGLGLWLAALEAWHRYGFLPSEWTTAQEHEAAAAVVYLRRLVTWYERQTEKRKAPNG